MVDGDVSVPYNKLTRTVRFLFQSIRTPIYERVWHALAKQGSSSREFWTTPTCSFILASRQKNLLSHIKYPDLQKLKTSETRCSDYDVWEVIKVEHVHVQSTRTFSWIFHQKHLFSDLEPADWLVILKEQREPEGNHWKLLSKSMSSENSFLLMLRNWP